jgi:hypothetical protein
LEGQLNVACIKGGGFDKREVVLAWSLESASRHLITHIEFHTCKLLSLLCGYSSQVSQIALVSDQHDDNVGIRMIPQLLQPSCNVLVCLVFADIVDKQSSHCAPVVCGCDCAVSLLPSSIPNLRLDRLCVYLDRSGCELYTDGGLRIEIELIACESTQQVGFTNAGVSDQYDCGGRLSVRRWNRRAGDQRWGTFLPLKRNCRAEIISIHSYRMCDRRTYVVFVVRHDYWLYGVLVFWTGSGFGPLQLLSCRNAAVFVWREALLAGRLLLGER